MFVKNFSIFALQSFLDWPRLLLSQDPPAECCRWRGGVGGQGETRETPGLHITCNVTDILCGMDVMGSWNFSDHVSDVTVHCRYFVFNRTTSHFQIGAEVVQMDEKARLSQWRNSNHGDLSDSISIKLGTSLINGNNILFKYRVVLVKCHTSAP